MILNQDARLAIKKAPGYKTIITDPIWPNHKRVFSLNEPSEDILRDVINNAPKTVETVVIVLGCDSDPRWLHKTIPERFPFLKNMVLEFVCPAKKGRNLYTHLTAYAFGKWPPSKKGARVLPSKHLQVAAVKKLDWHPTPMRIEHCKWLAKWWAYDGMLDPFAGSGTFGIACKDLGIPYWGCELNETYFTKASDRILKHQERLL